MKKNIRQDNNINTLRIARNDRRIRIILPIYLAFEISNQKKEKKKKTSLLVHAQQHFHSISNFLTYNLVSSRVNIII